jgi:hypothetical protein
MRGVRQEMVCDQAKEWGSGRVANCNHRYQWATSLALSTTRSHVDTVRFRSHR